MFSAVKKSTERTKAKLVMDLENKRVSSSVINQSVNEINNVGSVDGNNINTEFNNENVGQSEQKRLVRVRTMDTPGGVNPAVKPPIINKDNNQNYYGSSEEDNRYGMLGSATTLILICAAILIVLVAGVSFMIINFLGF